MGTLIMKFGGTSVGSAEAICSTAQIVRAARQDWPQLVVVASALSGVTDLLLKGAHTAADGDAHTFRSIAQDLRARHLLILNELIKPPEQAAVARATIEVYLSEFESLCHAVNVLGEASPRALDAISSLGERMSIQVIAAQLKAIGIAAEPIEASELVVTDAHFQAANPIADLTRAKTQGRLLPLLDKGITPVVTGFLGATQDGVITTLGRGGSDFSAAILGVALDADEVWIWTDVDGVLTTDPRIDPAAQTLPELTFREISELAYYGAKVLHPKTIRPVVERGIALWIKNTFNPQYPGTQIVRDNGQVHGGQNHGGVKAVTAIRGQTMITVEGRGMLGIPGVAARTFGAVARTHTSVSLISQASSEQSICFTVPANLTSSVVAAVQDEFRHELEDRDIDAVAALENVVIVTVVGAGMRHTPGIAGRVFGALGTEQINIIAIAQGSSECSISLIVDKQDADAAVRVIHRLIVNSSNIAS
ncbi:MAG TPA: aspartate kinase [Anaerolineae bacterium]|nr:aspartate kinase [Anaerolineae bacterium]